MTLRGLLNRIGEGAGLEVPDSWAGVRDEVALAQSMLSQINEYFYQTHEGIGTLEAGDKEYRYFSEFHKYWEANHASIINARLDGERIGEAAAALRAALQQYGPEIFEVTLDTQGLPAAAVAQVRFLTANQDFRASPPNPFARYLDDEDQFKAENINADPERFLGFIGVSRQAQGDKRIDFARNAAQFLLQLGTGAFEIAAAHGNDARQIRQAMLERVGMGYGRKKTDMFIRDMVALGVWPRLAGMEVVDVASDRNTMKLALRTGILQTDIPLLSSFLDIFGYQYAYIDEMSARAWRAVWSEWQTNHPESAPPAPCMLDFLLYRIGRDYCDDGVVEFACERGHTFLYFGARKRLCPTCSAPCTPGRRMLPCQVDARQLPRDEDGVLKLGAPNLLRNFDGVCILERVCRPKEAGFRKLSPPRAISIVGRTSWTDSYAFRGEGGGGMMA